MVLIIGSGCQQSEQVEQTVTPVSSDTIVASYGKESLRVDDLENYIVNLPADKRWSNSDPTQWLKNTIGQNVVEKKLLAEALLIGAQHEPKFVNIMRNLSRNAYVQQYLSASIQEQQGFTESDLKAYYDEHRDEYNLPEKRLVYHIFKNNKHSDAQQQLKQLKDRYDQGENFMLLAQQHSDSETRRNQGRLGLLKRGDMSADFDAIVFSLELNQTSDVVKTATGFHMFLVTDILPAKSYDFEQVKNQIINELTPQLGIEFLKEKALSLNEEEAFFVVSKDELVAMNNQRQNRSHLLKVGEYQLPYNQMLHELNELKKSTRMTIDIDKQMQYVQTVAYSEIIYQHMLDNKVDLLQSDLLKNKEEKLLVEHYLEVKMVSYLNNHPDVVQQYYDKNRMRFATPVRVKLQRLVVPKVDQLDIMPELESVIESLEKGDVSMQDLANQYHGKVQNLAWRKADQLAAIDKQILNYAFLLKVGEYSPPYTNAQFYSILHLLDRKESQEQELIQVRTEVIRDYVANNAAQLYSQISQDLLKDLQFNEQGIKDFINNRG